MDIQKMYRIWIRSLKINTRSPLVCDSGPEMITIQFAGWISCRIVRTVTRKSSTGRLYINAEGLDILNKYHCFIVLRISILGVLELCFGGAKPTNPPLWRWDYVAKLQLAFECNWLGKLLRLRDISSLQDLSNFLFISMTGLKVVQHTQVVSILLHEAKRVLGLFCLHLNTIGWSGHVTSTIHRDNWLAFKSLWLGFRIMAYGQGLVVQCLELGFSLPFT